jgi:hypothetical protein
MSGGGIPHQAWRGGEDDTEALEESGPEGGRRIEDLRMYALDLQVICTALYGKPNRSESYYG